jgi:hypothetical protein
LRRLLMLKTKTYNQPEWTNQEPGAEFRKRAENRYLFSAWNLFGARNVAHLQLLRAYL